MTGTPLGILAQIVLNVASFVLGLGAMRMALVLARGEKAHYQDIVPPTNLIWPYFAATVRTGLAVVGGLILLIIPCIWGALRPSRGPLGGGRRRSPGCPPGSR